MRTWRVGSFSMGGALIFLGVFLLLAQFFEWDLAILLLSWWPILFIILGVEILIYLKKGNEEKSNIKYDFISIVFIGLIGTGGLGLALLQTVGLLDVTSQFVMAEVREVDLPKYENNQLQKINQIQIEPGPYDISIEGTSNQEVAIFGTYVSEIVGDDLPIKQVSDYALIEQAGDIMYIKLKQMPEHRFNHMNRNMDLVVLIPEKVKLEVIGKESSVNLKPRKLQSDWVLSDLTYLQIDVPKEANMLVDVHNSYDLSGGKWGTKDQDYSEADSDLKSAKQTFGKGEHHLTIKNVSSVQIQ